MTTVKIEDGIYFLHPEGSCWIAAKFRGGRMRDMTEESLAATYAAARDSWSGIVPRDDDSDCDADVSESVVRQVMGDDVNFEMVVVTRSQR